VYPNIARTIHNPKRVKQFRKQPLTPQQATDLLAHFQGEALRDYAIVNLLVRTGLRTVEVCRADVGDITYKGNKRVLLIQGKGHTDKDSFVILTDKAYLPIKQYLETRPGARASEPLFVSKSNRDLGGRMATRSVSRIAKDGLKAIGLDEKVYTAHSLRHTTAVNILRAGGDLETVQFTLRHANINTTEIYTQTLNEERRLQNSGEDLLDSMY
jgi:Site-specific recombinase XerD